jgi:hypothetical protein
MNSNTNGETAQPTSKLDWALYYARHGKRVIPLHHIQKNGRCSCEKDCGNSAGKHPRLSEWPKVATRDEQTIRMWWSNWPRANIGVACGAESNLTGLDVDPGKGGWESLRAMEAELGPLPPTPRVITGRDGAHLLFQYVPGILNEAGMLAPGLDWRNEGGQLVGAGSVTVGGYRFEVGYSPEDLDFNVLPSAWVARAIVRQNGSTNGGGGSFHFDGEIPEGKRNAGMHAAMRSMKAKGFAPDAIWAAIQVENAKRCNPPLPERELRKEFEAAMKAADRPGFESRSYKEGAESSNSSSVKEPPRPLYRDIPPGEPYPVDALGDLGVATARNVHEATQAPLEICAQSVLASMNLAVMGHIDIELPTGDTKPISEFFATIAESGERKTAADDRATTAVRNYEMDHEQEFETAKSVHEAAMKARAKQESQVLSNADNEDVEKKAAALAALGPAAEPPVRPTILAGGDPTMEGLVRMFHEGGTPVAAIFTDEGGQFVGSHAMQTEVRARTAGTLSHLWDGKPLRRVRGGEGIYSVRGRRGTMHLLFQPGIAQVMFGDPVLRDQGLLTRFLVSMPPRLAGFRPFRRVGNFNHINDFNKRVTELLERPFPYADAEHPRKGLKPQVLKVSEEAQSLWAEFHDYVEALIRPDAALDTVRGLANKAPEHATRLAATIAYFEGDCDREGLLLSAQRMQAGIDLVDYYLHEALRIEGAATVNADLVLARKLLGWLHKSWEEPNGLISLSDIYRRCPSHAIRDKKTATRIVAILADHGWLEPCGPAQVNGTTRHHVWRIVRED